MKAMVQISYPWHMNPLFQKRLPVMSWAGLGGSATSRVTVQMGQTVRGKVVTVRTDVNQASMDGDVSLVCFHANF